MTEIQTKKERYKVAIDMCCMPFCNGDSTQLIAHHIIPVSKGGSDLYDNLIVLCTRCHGPRIALHHEYNKTIADLHIFKIKAEESILGFTSVELSDNGFDNLLVEFLKNKKYEEDLNFYSFEDNKDDLRIKKLYDTLIESGLDPHERKVQQSLSQIGNRNANEKMIMKILDKRHPEEHDENLSVLDRFSVNQLIVLRVRTDIFNILLKNSPPQT